MRKSVIDLLSLTYDVLHNSYHSLAGKPNCSALVGAISSFPLACYPVSLRCSPIVLTMLPLIQTVLVAGLDACTSIDDFSIP